MKYNDKEIIKETAIKLFLEGKNYTEISKLTNCSRNYISNLIRNDERVKDRKNKTVLKVYKNQKTKKMRLTLSIDFLRKIGISKDTTVTDYVDVILDENNEQIIIKNHKM